MDNTPLEILADIKIEEETDSLRKAVASVIDLPDNDSVDLLYFTALYVSTGANLNHVVFTPEELLKAKDSIAAKALDIEHKEDIIIGHLYDYAFIDDDGQKIDLDDIEPEDVADQDLHVVVAGVIYKDRFPKVAKEVASGKWKVSMECYYSGFDVQIGDVLLTASEVEDAGVDVSKVLGSMAKVMKDGVVIAQGKVTKVLRDILFSGCGIVKRPANLISYVLSTASDQSGLDNNSSNDDKSNLVIEVASDSSEGSSDKNVEGKDDAALDYKDTVGICVSYKKEVIDTQDKNQDTNVIHTDWCTKYDTDCTSSTRDTSDSECLYTKSLISEVVQEVASQKEANDRRTELVNRLTKLVIAAKKWFQD